MPSPIHTALVELLEAHPEALAYLMELTGNAPSGPLIPTTGTRSKTFLLERRVDRAYLVGSREAPLGFVLAEVQLDDDGDKRYAWPLYVELARTRYRCEGALVVLTIGESVRRWIERDITPPTGQHGSSRQLLPKVVALDVIDPALLLQAERPYLATLAIAAHATSPAAQTIAEAAVDVTMERLPKHLAAEHLDAILGMVDAALRAHLEHRIMEHHEYKSELFRGIYQKGEAEGEAKGEAKGKAESVLAVLTARGLPVSDAIRTKILACTDADTLDLWVRRAAVATTTAAVVRTAAAPRSKRSVRRAKKS